MVVTEAPSVHRATEFVCQFYQQFIYKAFTPKQLSRICTLYLRRSLCRRHLRNIAFTSVPSVTPCAYYIRPFCLSLYISEEPLFCYVLRSLLTLSAKVGVQHDLFYIFLHKVYLYAHYYKVCVLKYIKIGVVRLRYYFPFYYLCKIE